MKFRKPLLASLFGLCVVALAGCGGSGACGNTGTVITPPTPAITFEVTEAESQLTTLHNGQKFDLNSLFDYISANGNWAHFDDTETTDFPSEKFSWDLELVSQFSSPGKVNPLNYDMEAKFNGHTLEIMPDRTRGGFNDYLVKYDGNDIGTVPLDYQSFRTQLQQLILAKHLPIKASYTFSALMEAVTLPPS